jgi:hypothetical protein
LVLVERNLLLVLVLMEIKEVTQLLEHWLLLKVADMAQVQDLGKQVEMAVQVVADGAMYWEQQVRAVVQVDQHLQQVTHQMVCVVLVVVEALRAVLAWMETI